MHLWCAALLRAFIYLKGRVLKDETYQPKILKTKCFGELPIADVVVPQAWKPKGKETTQYVDDILSDLGFSHESQRKSSIDKLRFALSDFLVATRIASGRNHLLSWVGKNDHYTGGAYNADIMRMVRRALEGIYLQEVQQSSKYDKLARLYAVTPDIVPYWLTFEHHGLGECVVVRSAKDTWETGKTGNGGKRLPRKRFLPEIEPLEKQVSTINACLLAHPLEFWDGREFAWCRRIFNNGRLDQGGRLYGPWQTESEHDRLCSRIDGEDVCEIDLKASYPSIINATLGNEGLGPDPYSTIDFVQEDPTKRAWAKDLISAHVSSKRGLSQFPRGFRAKHNLHKKDKIDTYKNGIFASLPFLRDIHKSGVNWMYVESEFIVSTLESLARQDIPAYPVHDSVICKQSDKETVINVLQNKMAEYFGTYINLDIAFLTEDGEIIEETPANPKYLKANTPPKFSFSSYDWGIDDDPVLIE